MDICEKKVRETTVYNGNFFDLRKDDVLLPNNKNVTREFVTHPGAACVLAIDENGDVLLVKQYRYPMSELLIEIPAGKIDVGETPIDCAKRELEEETGYQAQNLDLLTAIYPAPAYTTEVIYIYLASGLSKTRMNLDEDEFLTCQKVKLSELVKMVLKNEIKDAKTQVAILKYLAINPLKITEIGEKKQDDE